MNEILRLPAAENLSPSMPDVLAPLGPDGHALHWTIFDLGEVITADRWDLNLPYIQTRVRESSIGLELSFEDLLNFAVRRRQVIDGLFVGCERPNNLPRRSDSDLTVLTKADMLVASIDSSYWFVGGSADARRRVHAQFDNAAHEDSGSIQLSTWGR